MKTIDLDLSRKLIGKVKLKGKTYDIYQQTIGQTLQHTAEAREAQADLDKFREANDGDGFVKRQAEWLIREIQIFVPELKDADIKGLSQDQRVQIMNLVFGLDEEEEKRVDKDLPQKKTKASHGGK